MRLVLCFSRSCRPYPTTLALRSLPCWPGAKLRFSMGHLSLKHLGPFKNNFMPSRRQRRHTGPLYLAILSPLVTSCVDRFTGWLPLLPDPFFFRAQQRHSPAAPSRSARALPALAPRSPYLYCCDPFSQLPNYKITHLPTG